MILTSTLCVLVQQAHSLLSEPSIDSKVGTEPSIDSKVGIANVPQWS